MYFVGGDFYYPNEKITQPDHNILLVAGGIGINPLFSILQRLMELKSKSTQGEGGIISRPTLI
jgi:ferredoxin-NADP reductase